MKPFEEMTAADYAHIGLKSGLEIHQQLLTQKKLFCRCPAGNYSETFDAEILRHMRPTLSELGEYDGTALMEFKTKKEIIYQINHKTVCTYEMDDTPPFEINQEALDIALQIALLLQYHLVSEIHIARKQYLDGSIPTGFQRTTIVGIDGQVPFKDRRIDLVQLGLEEDSCREVSDLSHQRTYLTDRLGMPLIEIVTQPQMYTPQEVAEVAELLRRLVRSTGRVRTGIGAARQDVNVSIQGGTRVEIKGVPRIPLIPLLIYNEGKRQYNLLRIRDELKKRGITEKTFQHTSTDVTSLVSNTTWDPLRRALKRGECVYCVSLSGFAGILKHPTQTDKVFSREISDRVRVIACLTRLPNICTTDGSEETIDSVLWKKIRRSAGANSRDALVLVWGQTEDVKTAVQEICIRAREATLGIPNETRQALADGTNGFERILPGPDRMYPDTDLPPLEITNQRIQRLKKEVPEPIWKREQKYSRFNLPDHLIHQIAASPDAAMFESFCAAYSVQPVHIAILLFEKPIAWKRKTGINEKIDTNIWRKLFQGISQYPAILEAADQIMERFLTEDSANLDAILNGYSPLSSRDREVQLNFERILAAETILPDTPEKTHRYLMGKMMAKYRGRIQGKHMSRFLNQQLKSRVENERDI